MPPIGVPSKRTMPSAGASRPETTRNTVVLPAPLAPKSAVNPPSATVSETPANATRGP